MKLKNVLVVFMAAFLLCTYPAGVRAEGNASLPTASPTQELSEKENPDATLEPTQSPLPSASENTPFIEPEPSAPPVEDVPAEVVMQEAEKTPVEDEGAGVVYEPGVVLVSFKQDMAPMQAMDLLQETEIITQEAIDETTIKKNDPVLVEIEPYMTVEEAAAVLNENPVVEYAQPNYLYHELESQDYGEYATTTINDPLVSQQWYLENINVYEAWDYQKTNQAVKVAVIDSGIVTTHPDLRNNIDFANAYDEYWDRPLIDDISGHGTHVAGIVAAEANNGIGMAGISYNASIVPINVFRIDPVQGAVASTSDISDAYNRIMNIENLRVINMSLGQYNSYDRVLEQKIDEATAKGIMTVCAGGNGDKYGVGREWPVYPSDFKACVSVVPIGENDQRPGWADYNEQKDISAPGLKIWSTSAAGDGAWYEIKQGSSMAAPVVSAVAAMIFAADPSLSVQQAKDIMYSTAIDIGDAGKDIYYGWGKVNAAGAVKKAHMLADTKAPTLQKIDKSADPSTAPIFYVAAQGVTDDKSGVKSVQLAVWSEKNGQDDLKWYDAINNIGNGWLTGIDVRNHKNDTGRYQIHIYGTDGAGNRALMGTTTIVLDHIDTKAPTLQKIDKSADPSKTPVFYIAAQGVTDDKSGVKSVQYAVWSENNGQDDLKWYDAINNGYEGWFAGIDARNHKNDAGRYQIHIYGTDNTGNRGLMGATTIVLDHKDTKAPTLQKIEKSTDPSKTPVFYIAAQGVTDDKSGVKSVQYAVWSENNGQDDLKWYDAINNGYEGWFAGIDARNHKNDAGRYQIHIYGTDNTGNRGLMGATTIVLDHKDTKAPTLQKIEKSTDPSKTPVFYVAAKGVADDKSGVKSVQCAVWSENNGQDDLKWYDATNDTVGGWVIGVDIWNHQSDKGRYQVHIYGTDNAGNRALMGTTTMTVL